MVTSGDVSDLDRLLTIEAIKQLKARYFRYLDSKRFEDLMDVFTADAHVDTGYGVPTESNRDFVDSLIATVTEPSTVHHGHMPEIEVLGPDRARGIWAMFDYVDFEAKGDAPRNAFHGYGHYEEEYRREGDAWRISSMRLTRLRVDPIS
jgi:3-phenylpropionate/cinnamic acid dioxygenase small subunit